MYYDFYGDYGTPAPKKITAKVGMVVFKIGTLEKYKVHSIDTLFNLIELKPLNDKRVTVNCTAVNFDKEYKEIWF